MPTKSLLRSIFRNSHQKHETIKDPPTVTLTPAPSSLPTSTSAPSLDDVLTNRTLTNQPSTSSFLSTTSTTSTTINTSPLAHKHQSSPQSRPKSRASTTILLNPIVEERSLPNAPATTNSTPITPSKYAPRTPTPYTHASSSPYQDLVPIPIPIPTSGSTTTTPTTPNTPPHPLPPFPPDHPSPSHLLPAALQEAKLATLAHLDTLQTTLALLDALHGFSETITVLKEEMREKVKTCEERLEMIGDVEGLVGEE